MGKVTFAEAGWEHYQEWLSRDPKTVMRINALIKSIQRDGPGRGIGKPEKLRHRTAWSRRIDERHRLVYKIMGEDIEISDCWGHYE